MSSRAGRINYESTKTTTLPLPGEIIYYSFRRPLVGPSNIASTVVSGVSSRKRDTGDAENEKQESIRHHGLVQSVQRDTNTGEAHIQIWPVPSFHRSTGSQGLDGMALIARMDDDAKNKFIPVPYKIILGFPPSKEYCETSTPAAFLRLMGSTGENGVVDTGSYIFNRPAWIVMDLHEDTWTDGDVWHRFAGSPRVPFVTLQRLMDHFIALDTVQKLSDGAGPCLLNLVYEDVESDSEDFLDSLLLKPDDGREGVIRWLEEVF